MFNGQNIAIQNSALRIVELDYRQVLRNWKRNNQASRFTKRERDFSRKKLTIFSSLRVWLSWKLKTQQIYIIRLRPSFKTHPTTRNKSTNIRVVQQPIFILSILFFNLTLPLEVSLQVQVQVQVQGASFPSTDFRQITKYIFTFHIKPFQPEVIGSNQPFISRGCRANQMFSNSWNSETRENWK